MSNVKFVFLKDSKNFPRICLAYIPSKDSDSGLTEFAYSVLNKKDKYNRKLAREIAQGRAEINSIKAFLVDGESDLFTAMDVLAGYIFPVDYNYKTEDGMNDFMCRQLVQKLARRWLVNHGDVLPEDE